MDDDYAEASSEMVSVKEWLEKKNRKEGKQGEQTEEYHITQEWD